MSNSFKTSEGFCLTNGCDQLAYSNYNRGYSPKSFPLSVKTKECFCSSCDSSKYNTLGRAFSNNPFIKLVPIKENFTESMNQQDAYLGMNRAYGMDNFPQPTGGKSCISITRRAPCS